MVRAWRSIPGIDAELLERLGQALVRVSQVTPDTMAPALAAEVQASGHERDVESIGACAAVIAADGLNQ